MSAPVKHPPATTAMRALVMQHPIAAIMRSPVIDRLPTAANRRVIFQAVVTTATPKVRLWKQLFATAEVVGGVEIGLRTGWEGTSSLFYYTWLKTSA